MTERARVLLVITVYNGRSFVPDALRSAVRVSTDAHDVDVLVLDDHSPEPGWSEELHALCAELGIRYYLTPRNLGIPRNVNLGLLAAVDGDYSHVIIANSDVIFPANLVTRMVQACRSDERIASVTAFSNNASIYSLPNSDPNHFLSAQSTVDWISETLAGNYGDATIDVPAGISFCIMIPTWAVRQIGLMDPIFGRGYCEETDWSLRSRAYGYRCTVSPGVFVYHAGKGSNESAGLISSGASTVDAHELIVDLRYPLFRSEVAAFIASGMLPELHDGASLAICRAGARQYGYSIELGDRPLESGADHPTISIDTSGSAPLATVRFLGVKATLDLALNGDDDLSQALVEFGGGPATGVNLLERGPRTQHLARLIAGPIDIAPAYPTRV